MTTPRSGNTWLRHLVGAIYAMPSIAVNNPREVDWDHLPERCVLAVHWHPEKQFLEQLAARSFRSVTMCRHPLDVLASILHFASVGDNAEMYTARWLEGEQGNEDEIVNAMPTSQRFIRYAQGPRARALLSVSREWSTITDCTTVSYESLVANPVRELTRLVGRLEPVEAAAIASAVDAHTFEKMKRSVQNEHHWQGSPGHWKLLFPARAAREIAAAHAESFTLFHYDCEPDESLTRSEALIRWCMLDVESLKRDLRRLQSP